MFRYIWLTLAIILLVQGSGTNKQNQYLLLHLPDVQIGVNSPYIPFVEFFQDGNYIVALGFQSTEQNQRIVTTYIWDFLALTQNNITPKQYIDLNPITTRTDVLNPLYFDSNLVISPDGHHTVIHSETQIDIVQLPTLSLQTSLPISSDTTARIAAWSADSSLLAFIVYRPKTLGIQLLVWDWINNITYEKEFDFFPYTIIHVNNQWLFWGYSEYFATCSNNLTNCMDYKPENIDLSFLYPTRDGNKIIGGQRIENTVYQIITWHWINDNYEVYFGPIVDFGDVPYVMSDDGSYIATSSDIFETTNWRHISHVERSGRTKNLFTSDNKSLITLDYPILSIFDTLSGQLQDSINIQNIFNLDEEQFAGDSSGVIQLSNDGKWVIIKFISVIALVPLNSLTEFR